MLFRIALRLLVSMIITAALPVEANVLFSATNSENSIPLDFTGEYQQTYGASGFPGLGPTSITGMAFAVDPVNGYAFSGDIASIDISLSTIGTLPSAITGLVALGSDSVLVHTGPLHLSGSDNHSTAVYDVVIPFTQAFNFDPAKGTLLVDIRKNSPENPFPYMEAGNNSLISRAFPFAGSTYVNVGYGVSTLFLTVPEPGTQVLMALGLVVALSARPRKLRSR